MEKTTRHVPRSDSNVYMNNNLVFVDGAPGSSIIDADVFVQMLRDLSNFPYKGFAEDYFDKLLQLTLMADQNHRDTILSCVNASDAVHTQDGIGNRQRKTIAAICTPSIPLVNSQGLYDSIQGAARDVIDDINTLPSKLKNGGMTESQIHSSWTGLSCLPTDKQNLIAKAFRHSFSYGEISLLLPALAPRVRGALHNIFGFSPVIAAFDQLLKVGIDIIKTNQDNTVETARLMQFVAQFNFCAIQLLNECVGSMSTDYVHYNFFPQDDDYTSSPTYKANHVISVISHICYYTVLSIDNDKKQLLFKEITKGCDFMPFVNTFQSKYNSVLENRSFGLLEVIKYLESALGRVLQPGTHIVDLPNEAILNFFRK